MTSEPRRDEAPEKPTLNQETLQDLTVPEEQIDEVRGGYPKKIGATDCTTQQSTPAESCVACVPATGA